MSANSRLKMKLSPVLSVSVSGWLAASSGSSLVSIAFKLSDFSSKGHVLGEIKIVSLFFCRKVFLIVVQTLFNVKNDFYRAKLYFSDCCLVSVISS